MDLSGASRRMYLALFAPLLCDCCVLVDRTEGGWVGFGLASGLGERDVKHADSFLFGFASSVVCFRTRERYHLKRRGGS
jgi:hypothetical protein